MMKDRLFCQIDLAGLFGTGAAQHRRRRRVANHRAQVETILQLGETLAVVIDHRYVVLFRNEAFGDARADLARAKNDYFHDFPPVPFLEFRLLIRLRACRA